MGMANLNDFQFSQASLQDFQDCRRRFYLKYVEKLGWPAIEAEPALLNEELMQQGADFHRLVHQFFLGVPPKLLSQMVSGENLKVWWENFMSNLPATSSSQLFPERVLTTHLAGYGLLAKFDLIVLEEKDKFIIYDWKTSRKPGSRSWLKQRLQTKVYPYVLAKAGHVFLDGERVNPEKIKMVYWYANSPEESVKFDYPKETMVQDEEFITSMIVEIASLEGIDDYLLTDDKTQCRFCEYRSLCNRGEKAGLVDDKGEVSQAKLEVMIDFEQIQEIEF
jgi:hypothetical protein